MHEIYKYFISSPIDWFGYNFFLLVPFFFLLIVKSNWSRRFTPSFVFIVCRYLDFFRVQWIHGLEIIPSMNNSCAAIFDVFFNFIYEFFSFSHSRIKQIHITYVCMPFGVLLALLDHERNLLCNNDNFFPSLHVDIRYILRLIRDQKAWTAPCWIDTVWHDRCIHKL